MPSENVYVAQPSLPPLEDFIPYLREIWSSRVLTNSGPFHSKFEEALRAHLGVEHVSLFANGTLALVTALQALQITGEVITTPYSFVATAHSLLWNGSQPVFVDVDPLTLNIDPQKIEAAITPRTTAILPVHCYGHPCNVEAIREIADTYGLSIIYDAAHAFGVKVGERSVLAHGDLSTLSFHATKVFNTFEGGAIICADAEMKQRIDRLKNFGFVDELTVVAPGINAKMNEFSAALGILQLERIAGAIAARKNVDRRYREALTAVPGIHLLPATQNFSYFPILVRSGYKLSRDALYEKLRGMGIHGRRYFYPLISEFPMYRGLPSAAPENLPVATRVAEEVICLPMYEALDGRTQDRIISLIV